MNGLHLIAGLTLALVTWGQMRVPTAGATGQSDAAPHVVARAAAADFATPLAPGDVPRADPAPPKVDPDAPAADDVWFTYVDIIIDSPDKPLGAYQVEIQSRVGNAKLVGLSGGAHPAFSRPPYYDTHALLAEKIIVAAFSTDADLPQGKTRVARLDLAITGIVDPQFEVKLHTAAGADGAEIRAVATLESPVLKSEGDRP